VEIRMAQLRIAVIVGSLRRESFNRKLADALPGFAPADFAFTQLRIDDLPLYNQDDDDHQSAPVMRLKGEVAAAHGLIFVTPEYNRSIPGVLKKRARPGIAALRQERVAGQAGGRVGVSIGAVGTAIAQQHLRNVLAYLDVPTLGQPEVFIHAKEGVFDASGNLGESARKFVQGWMNQYVAFLKRHTG
jgi:chromate reductase